MSIVSFKGFVTRIGDKFQITFDTNAKTRLIVDASAFADDVRDTVEIQDLQFNGDANLEVYRMGSQIAYKRTFDIFFDNNAKDITGDTTQSTGITLNRRP